MATGKWKETLHQIRSISSFFFLNFTSLVGTIKYTNYYERIIKRFSSLAKYNVLNISNKENNLFQDGQTLGLALLITESVSTGEQESW
jgi:hypothetical protein